MTVCRLQWVFVLLVIALGTASMLASCGQRGDLYLPENAPQQVAPPDEAADVPELPDAAAQRPLGQTTDPGASPVAPVRP